MRTLRTLMFAVFALALAVSARPAQAADAGTPKVIEVHAKKYEFVPAQITVVKGVPFTLKLISDDVLHSLVIPDLKVNEVMKVGETEQVTVTPTVAGDFKGICGKYCGEGHLKMAFTVHVVNP